MKIICLHRVVPKITEELWPYRARGTVITVKELDELLVRLKKTDSPVPAADLIEVLKTGRDKNTFAITFDDGYKDNLLYAADVLKAHGLDATLFYVTGLMEGLVLPVDTWYWMFTRPSAGKFTVTMEGHDYKFDLSNPESVNFVVLGRMKEEFLNLPPEQRSLFIQKHLPLIRTNSNPAALSELYLTRADLKRLYQDYGWRIASHSHTHRFLDNTDQPGLFKEIWNSIIRTRELPGFLPLFAYPDARTGPPVTDKHLKDAGIKFSFILGNREVSASDAPMRIPRYVSGPYDDKSGGRD